MVRTVFLSLTATSRPPAIVSNSKCSCSALKMLSHAWQFPSLNNQSIWIIEVRGESRFLPLYCGWTPFSRTTSSLSTRLTHSLKGPEALLKRKTLAWEEFQLRLIHPLTRHAQLKLEGSPPILLRVCTSYRCGTSSHKRGPLLADQTCPNPLSLHEIITVLEEVALTHSCSYTCDKECFLFTN